MIQYTFEQIMAMTSSDIARRVSAENLNAFTRPQQAKIVGKIAATANKRRESLKKASRRGVPSYAYEQIKGKPRFTTKGKKSKALKTEFKRISKFIKDPTSTVKGAKKISKGISQKAKTEYDVDLSATEINTYAELWGLLKNNYSDFVSLYTSEQIRKAITEVSKTTHISSKSSAKEKREALEKAVKNVINQVGGQEAVAQFIVDQHTQDKTEYNGGFINANDEDDGDNPFLL